ncbi:hypothetical protein ABKN59_003046 [Abortiporus biennis]
MWRRFRKWASGRKSSKGRKLSQASTSPSSVTNPSRYSQPSAADRSSQPNLDVVIDIVGSPASTVELALPGAYETHNRDAIPTSPQVSHSHSSFTGSQSTPLLTTERTATSSLPHTPSSIGIPPTYLSPQWNQAGQIVRGSSKSQLDGNSVPKDMLFRHDKSITTSNSAQGSNLSRLSLNGEVSVVQLPVEPRPAAPKSPSGLPSLTAPNLIPLPDSPPHEAISNPAAEIAPPDDLSTIQRHLSHYSSSATFLSFVQPSQIPEGVSIPSSPAEEISSGAVNVFSEGPEPEVIRSADVPADTDIPTPLVSQTDLATSSQPELAQMTGSFATMATKNSSESRFEGTSTESEQDQLDKPSLSHLETIPGESNERSLPAVPTESPPIAEKVVGALRQDFDQSHSRSLHEVFAQKVSTRTSGSPAQHVASVRPGSRHMDARPFPEIKNSLPPGLQLVIPHERRNINHNGDTVVQRRDHRPAPLPPILQPYQSFRHRPSQFQDDSDRIQPVEDHHEAEEATPSPQSSSVSDDGYFVLNQPVHPKEKHRTEPYRYLVKGKLGEGSYGKVYLAVDLDTRNRVAVKVVMKSEETKREFLLSEMKWLKEIDRTEYSSVTMLMPLYAAWETADMFFCVTPAASHNLFDHIMHFKKHLHHDDRVFLAAELIEAVSQLHALNIAHRDIKPANILIAPDGHLVLTDFGLSESFHRDPGGFAEKDGKYWSVCGTDGYMAPEIDPTLRHVTPNWLPELDCASLDVYAAGVTIEEIFLGQLPMNGIYKIHQVYKLPIEVQLLVSQMLMHSPLHRPNIFSLKEAPMFKNLAPSWETIGRDRKWPLGSPPWMRPCEGLNEDEIKDLRSLRHQDSNAPAVEKPVYFPPPGTKYSVPEWYYSFLTKYPM